MPNQMDFESLYDKVGSFVRDSVDSAKDFFVNDFRIGVFETDTTYVVEAILPGVTKDRVAVAVDKNVLTITVNPVAEGVELEGFFQKAAQNETLRRDIRLQNIMEDSAAARMEDGILYITVEKAIKEETGQTIDIA